LLKFTSNTIPLESAAAASFVVAEDVGYTPETVNT
jgi:hypothetical protein